MMGRLLLLIAVAACGAYAVPLPADGFSAVDLVPPRRVATAGSRAGPAYSAAAAGGFRPSFDTRDILRQLFGSAGFPRLVPRVNPNCDSGKFELSDAVYDMVEQCQRSRSVEQDLKQCIVEGLPDDAGELKEFLDRDEYSITGISSSFSIVIVDGQMRQKRAVTFRLCPPSDDQNTVEEDPQQPPQQPQPPQARPDYRPQRPTFPFGGSVFGPRPTFQMPDMFSPQPHPFFNFQDAFKPIFDMKPSNMFPTFPNIDFDTANFPIGYDPDTCVKQTFQLPKEQFDKTRSCQVGSKSFKECLDEQLSGYEEAKEMLEFVGAEDMVVVDSRFFSSVSSINGVVTRKNKIQLTHCQRTETEEAPGDAGQDEEQEEEQEGQEEREEREEREEEQEEEEEEEEQEEADATPQETPLLPIEQQEAYLGEDFEP